MKALTTLALVLGTALSAQAQQTTLYDLLVHGAPNERQSAPRVETSTSFAMHAATLLKYFPVVIVINKATHGPTAQKAQIYMDGAPFWEVPVSTGRETPENAKSGKSYLSITPVGWFSPTRQVEDYFSNTWQAPMPFSTFFHGGIAIHAALPNYYGKLGSRASGGCVRMHPTYAKAVYRLIQGSGTGMVPEFTRHGGLKKDASGNLVLRQGWNTLIIVEDRPGK